MKAGRRRENDNAEQRITIPELVARVQFELHVNLRASWLLRDTAAAATALCGHVA